MEPFEKTYFLLNMGIFQPSYVSSQRGQAVFLEVTGFQGVSDSIVDGFFWDGF